LIDVSGIDESNSFIEWKINGTTQSPVSFNHIGGDTFVFNFPNISTVLIGDLIEYRLVAQDLSSEQNISYHPTSGYHSFLITDRISFEQNQFSHNWSFSGDAEWTVTDFDAQDGTFSMRSGEITHSSTTSISLTFSNDLPGNVTFHKKVSSEMEYDYLRFYIDEVKKSEWSGTTNNWSFQSFPVDSGSHTLRWEYMKDVNATHGSDAAWVDNITLPGNSSIGTTDTVYKNMYIYPNPANNVVYLFFNESNIEKVTVEIFSMSGKLIKSIENHKSNEAINTSNIDNGMYIIRAASNKHTKVEKLIIAK